MSHPSISLPRIHLTGSRSIFNPRRGSLIRGMVLVLGSFVASFRLSGFPESRRTLLLTIPAFFTMLGTMDTVRCMRVRWTWYQSGVFLLLLMDVMALCLILFFLFAPYLF